MSLLILPARKPGNRVLQRLDHYNGLTSVGPGAFQAAGRRVADDVVGDVAHGRVQVVVGPGLVVSQPGPQRGTGGICHGYLPFLIDDLFVVLYLVRYAVRMLTVNTLRCTHADG